MKPFPLKPLLDLSKARLDDATRSLGELIAKENEGHRKLVMLQEYRAEYQSRFEEAARAGMGPDAWRNYAAFLSRIDEAIAVQTAQVAQSHTRTAMGKQSWMHERNRSKAFHSLHDRHLADEMRKLAKSEQRQADEHSANRHRARQGETD
ncbi:MAG: flagellar export protein FliJ [Rhodocyclaceae bacterium]